MLFNTIADKVTLHRDNLSFIHLFIHFFQDTQMKTEDKCNVPKVRIVVLGNVNVGKSALTVRYLTRRFIGEYRSNTDLLYSQTITHENGLLDVEIIDISTEQENDFPLEQVIHFTNFANHLTRIVKLTKYLRYFANRRL